MNIDLQLLDQTQLAASFVKKFFLLKKIEVKVQDRLGKRVTSLQKLVQPLIAYAGKGELSKCDTGTYSRFLEQSLQVLRWGLVDRFGFPVERGKDTQSAELLELCAWLCSLSSAGSPEPELNFEAAGTWILGQLWTAQGLDLASTRELIENLLMALEPLNLPRAKLLHRAQMEFIFYVTKNQASGRRHSPEVIALAKEWCAEVIKTHPTPHFLKDAARSLGITPTNDTKPGSKEERKPNEFIPEIFVKPRKFTSETLRNEWEKCLADLLGVKTEEVLAQGTARRVVQLSPNTAALAAADVMYLASKDIWDAYWKRGDAVALPAARQFIAFAYNVQRLYGRDARDRSRCLNLALALQLPDLIHISSLEPICKEAEPLFKSEGSAYNQANVFCSIVQAVAGACRAAEHEKKKEERDTLLALHGEQLRDIIKALKRLIPDKSNDGVEAWLYLAALIGEPENATSKIDPNLIRLVNRGNHLDVLTFINVHLEEIRNGLERKLTRHRLSNEHLIRPTGKVINPHAAARGSLLPDFETALRHLDENHFERAAGEYSELASNRKLSEIQRNICRDYQAYALAKADKLIQAKPLLRGLCEANYRYSSSYWNRACIEMEREAQLSALVLGLERAPNPQMLEAAVYLSVVLDRHTDEQASLWLNLTPFLEALMLQYHHEAERLDMDESGRTKRDDLLKRIAAYIEHGDPEVPDPTGARVSPEAISKFHKDLKLRDHLEVIAFWFQCQRIQDPRFRDLKQKTEYYMLRTDIFDDLGQRNEAAANFYNEMECHLDHLNFRLKNTSPDSLPSRLLHDIRIRLERQLRACMLPELEPVGRKLYRIVQEWQDERDHQVILILDGPPQRKIHEFYDSGGEPLNKVLIRVSGEMRQHLHDIQDYPRHKAMLIDVFRALESAAKQKSMQALRNLTQKWEDFLRTRTPEDQKNAASEAQAAYGPLLASLEQELSREQLEMANGLLYAVKRVNGKHTPGPKLIVYPVPDATPTFRGDGIASAFCLRAKTEAGSSPARLTQVTARLKDGEHQFRLLDDLGILPVVLRPDKSTLLTFEDNRTTRGADDCELEVEFGYEYLGQVLQTAAIKVKLQMTTRPEITVTSPYIYGRALSPEETVGRFFGRNKELELLLDILTGTSHKIAYVEGIRGTGKTSLFNTLRHHFSTAKNVRRVNGTVLLPVRLSGGSVGAFTHVGQILHYFISDICRVPELVAAGVVAPDENACCSNMMTAYEQFHVQLKERMPSHSIIAFWDDFQSIVDLAQEIAFQDQRFLVATRAFLDIIRDQRGAESRIVWLLAGYRSKIRFITQLPKVNLWAELEPLQIDFLDLAAVQDILATPLRETPIKVAGETVERVYEYTRGHPDTVQRIADKMLACARPERRCILTPADADAAARMVTDTQAIFADTWCPLGEISATQRTLIGSFINVVKQQGANIEPHRLFGGGGYTDTARKDVDDLVSRKILERRDNGTTIGIKAPVLEMWMRNYWRDEEPPLSAAIFIDLANLTNGTGSDVIDIPGLSFGDVVSGQFKLKTILDAIDHYAEELVPTPVVEKWTVNYPPGSRAVPILDLNQYHVKHIDKSLFEKGKIQRGSDDVTLFSLIAEITSDRPAITHIVIVTGDKDMKLVGVQNQLVRGKSVHILTYRKSAAPDLIRLANQYPKKCTLVYLEELLSAKLTNSVT